MPRGTGCSDSREEKEDVLREVARVTRTRFLPFGPGSKEKKASLVSAANALGVAITRGTKQDYAEAIVQAGRQRWDKSCWSTGDTVTCIGLERVRAAAVLLAINRLKLRASAELFLLRESHVADADTRPSSPGRIHLRELREPKKSAVSLAAFLGSTSPERRRVLLEKALAGHRSTLAYLASAFNAPCAKYEDPESIDLLIRCPGRKRILVEVKTVFGDPVSAARRALSQVYEYRYRLGKPRVVLGICFDRPIDRPDWLLNYLTKDRRINVLWTSGAGFVIKGPEAELFRAQMHAAAV